MKFSAVARALAEAIAPVARLADPRSTIPILAHMRLEIAGGRLIASAFDLDREAETTAEVEGAAAGATTVSAARASEILRNLPKEARVTIEVDDMSATLKSGRSRFVLPTLPATDFPRLAAAPFAVSFEIPAPDLRLALSATVKAAAVAEDRYYLQGVYLHPDEDSLAAVATDGHQLIRLAIACETLPAFDGVIIPTETVKEFIKICDGAGTKKVRLDVSRERIRLAAGDVAMTSKLVDGTFPAYQRVIPPDSKIRATFDREAALSALRRVAMAVSAEKPGILLESKDGFVSLRGRDGFGAAAYDDIEAEVEGAFRSAFNHKYLLAALDSLGGEMTRLEIGDRHEAKFVDPARGDRAVAVVMPVVWTE